MIQRVIDEKHIPEIIELAKKITVWDFNPDELRAYLTLYIASDKVLVLLDTELKSFSVSTVYRDMLTNYVLIMYAWTDPHYSELTKKEMALIKLWTKALDMNVIRIAVKKNVKAFCKKYGFYKEGTLLKMEV